MSLKVLSHSEVMNFSVVWPMQQEKKWAAWEDFSTYRQYLYQILHPHFLQIIILSSFSFTLSILLSSPSLYSSCCFNYFFSYHLYLFHPCSFHHLILKIIYHFYYHFRQIRFLHCWTSNCLLWHNKRFDHLIY